MTIETIIGAICLIIAMFGIFLAGIQYGFGAAQEEHQKQKDDSKVD